MEEIFIIGGNHHNTLGVLRSLGYKGVKSNLILVTEATRPYTKFSKYIKNLFIVCNDKDAVTLLIKKKKSLEHAVVIACSDGASAAIDQNYDQLNDVYSIPGCNGHLTKYMDKEIMSQTGKTVGFNVPRSWVVETVSDIDNVDYPCITKPILSKDGKKTDIKICKDRKMLEDTIQAGSCYRYQVQEYIEKDFEYQLIGLSINQGKEVVIPGISRCVRPCPGTNTGFLHYIGLDKISVPLEKCIDFIRKVGYSGLFSIEFLRDKNGIDYFMEMNFRNDGNAICVTASGSNLPYMWYLANTGGDYKQETVSSKFKPVYVMPEFADFSCFVLSRKISFWTWLKDVRRTDKFMEFDNNDMKPFFVELNNKFCSALRRIKYYLWKK